MTVEHNTSRTVNADRGREYVIQESSLIPIYEHWELHCNDCGYTDRDAYVVGVCPFCGGARAGPRLPPVEELLYELRELGFDEVEIARSIGLSQATAYRWKNENISGVNFSTHERLAKFHAEQTAAE